MGPWKRVCGIQGGRLHRVDKLCLTWEWEVSEKTGTADNICARVCVRVHRDATFDKHEEITMRCYQRVLSLAGGACQVWFSQTSRKRAMTPHIYLHRHTCLSKTRARLHVHRRRARLTRICLRSNTHMHMWPLGPWLCVCRCNGVPSRAGSVKKTNNKKEDADVLILTLPHTSVLKTLLNSGLLSSHLSFIFCVLSLWKSMVQVRDPVTRRVGK